MSHIVDKSIDTLKQGLESLKTIKQDKQEYRAHLARIKALPEEYRFVYEKAAGYMWELAGGDGHDILSLQTGLLELFEEHAAAGKRVVEVTGEDVAAFCDELLKNARTYPEKRREKLNRDVAEKLEDRGKA